MPAAPLHPLTLDKAIDTATRAMLACQRDDGHWVFELEADSTIPAEYILLKHYLGEPADPAMEAKFAAYIRARQGQHGGDGVDHSNVRPFHGSPVVSRSSSRWRIETTSWTI